MRFPRLSPYLLLVLLVSLAVAGLILAGGGTPGDLWVPGLGVLAVGVGYGLDLRAANRRRE